MTKILSIIVLVALLTVVSGYVSRAFTRSSLTRLQSTNGEQVYQLFVGNLPFNVDDKQLNELVSQRIGTTYKSLRIAQDKKTGKSRGIFLAYDIVPYNLTYTLFHIKGFGYIDFADNSEAEGSLNSLKGIVLDGREIKVDLAGPRSVNYERSNSYNNKDKENKFKPRTPQENSVFIGKIL